ncbi:Ff.00g028500.m01.CDS01 [Fusarium sp. VM40]|nr:Ff.00g028500.m01.CDS01 [Fusarium sp. VM40]
MRSGLFRLKVTKRGRERSGGIALAEGSTTVSSSLHSGLPKRKTSRFTKELLAVTGGVGIRRDEKMQAKVIECCRPWAKWFACYTQLLIMHKNKSNNDQELVVDVS